MTSNSIHDYSIVCPSRSPIPWLLKLRLDTKIVAKKIHFYKMIGSTQKLALSLAEKRRIDLDGTVIIAERQTDAVGTAGRRWISPTGGIWLSVILKPRVLCSQSILIMFLASLTVCEVIKLKTGLNPKIKWPNDVTINGRKACGILVDISAVNETICYAIIGIGMNVNNETKRIASEIAAKRASGYYGITSLRKELDGLEVNLIDLLGSVLEKLEYYYDQLQEGFHYDIIKKWKAMSEIFNKSIMIKEHDKVYEVIAVDVDISGAIIVKMEDGSIRKILSPEIIL